MNKLQFNPEDVHYGLDPICGLSIDIAGIKISLDPKKTTCNKCKLKLRKMGKLKKESL